MAVRVHPVHEESCGIGSRVQIASGGVSAETLVRAGLAGLVVLVAGVRASGDFGDAHGLIKPWAGSRSEGSV